MHSNICTDQDKQLSCTADSTQCAAGCPPAILERQLAGRSGVQFLAGATELPDLLWGPPARLFNASRSYFSVDKAAGA